MRTAVEKANELFIKFYVVELSDGTHLDKDAAIECALVAVDEILDNFGLVCNGQTFYTEHRAFDYYSAVKHELTKQQEQ
jgi:hypothetical protein